MADFRIDRIRFRWRGDWSANTLYVKDDVLRYGAKVFVCVNVHTSDTNFYNDLNNSTPKWSQMMDGQSWTGAWQPSTFYKIGELVKVGGLIYKCIEGHISNASVSNGVLGDELKWVYFARGEDWQSIWTPATLYNVDQTVIYGGSIWKCNTAHTSGSADDGLQFNASYWDQYSRSDNFRSDWTANTLYYPDDVVYYGGTVFRCKTGHRSATSNKFINPTNAYGGASGTGFQFFIFKVGATYNIQITNGGSTYLASETFTILGTALGGATPANDVSMVINTVDGGGAITSIGVNGVANDSNDGLEANNGQWETVFTGIRYRGDYTVGERYSAGELVRWSPGMWQVTTGHWATSATMVESNFNLWVPGLEFESIWTVTQYYQQGDVILYGGYTYVALKSNIGVTPAVTDASATWELQVVGYTFQGEWKSTYLVNDAVEPFPYKTGDVVRAGGDLYIAVKDNASVDPSTRVVYDEGTDSPFPWQLLVTGNAFKGPWKETNLGGVSGEQTYFPGDVVTVAGTLYKCILKHEANSSDAKPPLDFESENVGPYWILVATGHTPNVLEYPGDIKTQNDDSTRLRIGIGASGQVLKVGSNNIPFWEDFDVTPKVYYVSPDGIDDQTKGIQLAAPFKTIKFACDFINSDLAARSPATVFIKTGLYQEILPITVPRDTALVGDELRSTEVKPAAGYETSNMFYVNNGSGIRNMSLSGLSGTLGPINEYGTKRPTGGAFVSLNPGSGASDAAAWITTRSCYVQNVSTFGTGCVGLKVDGDLHNGGNRSIVANDFTQVIDQGIGFWVNGEGKSELVSVFTYYCHIGYLATSGGKVRATNGNNSYGDWGSVAEGVTPTETPITAKFNNRTQEAQIDAVYNDENEIFAFAYDHAGQDYTSATITIAGSGEGASGVINYENTRDGAVNKIRLLGPGDSTPAGGAGYTSKSGPAITGTATSIQLNAQFQGTSAQTVGQRIYIWEGTGRGQYGIIDSFNELTKECTVKKEFDNTPGWQHFLGGFAIETALDPSTKYFIEPRIQFSEPPYSTSSASIPLSGDYLLGASRRVSSTNVTILLGNGRGLRSVDSSNWTVANGIPTQDWNSLVGGKNNFMATSSTGGLARSQDGANWSDLSGNIGADIFKGCAWEDVSSQWVVVSSTGVVYISGDEGNTWSSQQVEPYDGSTAVFSKIAAGNGLIVISNDYGQTWESVDGGTTWELAANIGGDRYIVQHLSFTGDKFIASVQDSPFDDSTSVNKFFVSNANAAQSSTSAITVWTESETPPHTGPYTAVTSSQGTFLAITVNGEVAYSYDAVSWKQLTTLSGTYSGIVGGRFNGGYFVPLKSTTMSDVTVLKKGSPPLARVITNAGKVSKVQLLDTGSGYATAPTVTITDNVNITDVAVEARIASGVLSQPTFTNRGTGFINVSATIDGDGFADEFQLGKVVQIKELSREPGPGDLLYINGIEDQIYRVTQITKVTGSVPNLTAQFRISPSLKSNESPGHDTTITIRQQYSQVRLTGHDFLDIGTGGVTTTNYPELYTNAGFTEGYEYQANRETSNNGGGRVFYTSTDQNGNFRVGELFIVEQATGIVTLNADLFNLQGLSELALGGVVLGGTEVVIREFSTDPTMAANSDNVVPTQKAILTYIGSRVSGGGANLNVSGFRAGQIKVRNKEIFNEAFPETGQIVIDRIANLNGGFSGSLLALNFFTGGTASTELNEGDPASAIDSSNGYGE
tara:strand:- start:19022 stop:24175 length:5154 start_codon:yes stop_codon:yes gene_type:complete